MALLGFHSEKNRWRKLLSSSLNAFLIEKTWSIGGHTDIQCLGSRQLTDVFRNLSQTYDRKVAPAARGKEESMWIEWENFKEKIHKESPIDWETLERLYTRRSWRLKTEDFYSDGLWIYQHMWSGPHEHLAYIWLSKRSGRIKKFCLHVA